MDNPNNIIIENQLRKHYKQSLIGQITSWFISRKRYHIGQDIITDSNVKLLRFPKNISLGNSVILKEGTRICPTNINASISKGDRTTIGYHTMIFSSIGISVGHDCFVAPSCYLIDLNNQIKKKPRDK